MYHNTPWIEEALRDQKIADYMKQAGITKEYLEEERRKMQADEETIQKE